MVPLSPHKPCYNSATPLTQVIFSVIMPKKREEGWNEGNGGAFSTRCDSMRPDRAAGRAASQTYFEVRPSDEKEEMK